MGLVCSVYISPSFSDLAVHMFSNSQFPILHVLYQLAGQSDVPVLPGVEEKYGVGNSLQIVTLVPSWCFIQLECGRQCNTFGPSNEQRYGVAREFF